MSRTTMTKQARHYAINEILSSRVVTNQDELRLELKKRGCTVTQATLSRDLKELGVGWTTTGEKAHYVLQPADAEARILKPIVGPQVRSIEANDAVIVVKTLPACANVVAEFIDSLGNSEIIGTLAGDNTLLVIPRSGKNIGGTVQFLKHKLIEGA